MRLAVVHLPLACARTLIGVLLARGPAPEHLLAAGLALSSLLMHRAIARADEDTPIPEFVENMPQGVQAVVEKMVESRSPPNRFLFSLFGLPRSRFGSATTWLPDDSPMYAAIPHIGRWGLFVTGNVFTGYDWFNSKRGGRRFMGRNTLNLAGLRRFSHSELSARLALSFEPLTIGKRGYPLILQTGQEQDGKPIHDKQYELDFFRELAITYAWEITHKWAGTIYLAAAGEPALGPVTFTQRVSASADPLAPLTFQVQEASHASFGVITIGAFTRTFKLEASWFNGEVPAEGRYGLYIRKPDSYAIRLNWNPQSRWSVQVSYGFLERPVRIEPERSDHRMSASATHTYRYGQDASVASTLSVAERITTQGASTTAMLAESYWNIDGHHAVFSRMELTQRSGVELALSPPTRERHAVGTVVAGYVYYFGPYISLAPGLGVRASVSPMAKELQPDYGTRFPVGVMVFAQLRTAALPIHPIGASR
jgi:hypothetical protein